MLDLYPIDDNLPKGHLVSLEWLQRSCSTAIKESFIVGQFANYLFLLCPSSFTLVYLHFQTNLQIGVVSMEPGNVFELTNILLQNVFYIYIYILMFIVNKIMKNIEYKL